MAVALYPGTFDPLTNGHLDILRRGAALFERVVVAVGARVDKQTLLTADERVALVRASAKGMRNVEAVPFTGLVVDFAKAQGATVLLRGLRNPMDYEYETQMAVTNRRLAPGIETVFLVAAVESSFISSTLIKEILTAGGSVDAFVPDAVAKALRARKR
ncbi:MAG TPA: pantetheine-phosphate adenylyltransferase [Planctomycetota bacterium]|nr:pantetheine-phosphate adenylyltransferase [Planctomycetota bacterium]